MMRNKTALYVIRFLEATEMYLDGVESPVFSFEKDACSSRRVHSKYLDEARSKYPDESLLAHRNYTLPSSSLAAALINIVAGRASVGLSFTGEGVAELACSDGSVQYAVYNPFSGTFKACIVPKGEKQPIPYKLLDERLCGGIESKGDKHCATVLVLALLPFLMKDEEFKNGYDGIMHELYEVFNHKNDMNETMMREISEMLTIISDNTELRLGYDQLEASIYFNLDMAAEGELPLLNITEVKSGGHYSPAVSLL